MNLPDKKSLSSFVKEIIWLQAFEAPWRIGSGALQTCLRKRVGDVKVKWECFVHNQGIFDWWHAFSPMLFEAACELFTLNFALDDSKIKRGFCNISEVSRNCICTYDVIPLDVVRWAHFLILAHQDLQSRQFNDLSMCNRNSLDRSGLSKLSFGNMVGEVMICWWWTDYACKWLSFGMATTVSFRIWGNGEQHHTTFHFIPIEWSGRTVRLLSIFMVQSIQYLTYSLFNGVARHPTI